MRDRTDRRGPAWAVLAVCCTAQFMVVLDIAIVTVALPQMRSGPAAGYALLLTAPGPRPQAPPELAKLSGRERELVTLVAQGRTDAQIAEQLFISVHTVSSHLDRIRDKTSARRRADLTRLALTAGLV